MKRRHLSAESGEIPEQPEDQQAGDTRVKCVIHPTGLARPWDPTRGLMGRHLQGLVHFSNSQADVSPLLWALAVADTEFY